MGRPRVREERQALQSALLLGDAVGGWQGARGRRLPRHRADLAALELIEQRGLVTKGVAPAMLRVFAFGCPLYGPSPERKVVCRSEGEAGCSHIFGFFKELHFTLRALMEIRTPSPGQLSGLEGLGTGQVRKAPVRPVTHHRHNDLRNHGETCSSLKCA